MLTTAAAYGVRLMLHRGGARSTLAVRIHLAVTIAIVMALFVWSYWLARFELALSPDGFVFGATFTDDNIRSPVQIVKMIAAVAVILGVLSWPFHERLRFAVTPIVMLILVSIVGGAILPAAIQRFTVEPNELERETPYIERNIAATRAAFALNEIEEREFTADDVVDADDLMQNPEALLNVRLWDHRPLNTRSTRFRRSVRFTSTPTSMLIATTSAAKSIRSSWPPANSRRPICNRRSRAGSTDACSSRMASAS